MSIDLNNDARRVRVIFFISALALAITICAVGLYALFPEWRKIQNKAYKNGSMSSFNGFGIRQTKACNNDIDRCSTCHLGMEIKLNSNKSSTDKLFGPHPIPLDKHIAVGASCSLCHGGNGKALTIKEAHYFPGNRINEQITDPLMRKPHIEASCTRCHVPGDKPGMEHLVEGAKLYEELGCAVCHPLSGEGRGGWDFGPDLRVPSRKSVQFLETSVMEPTADFPKSTMPSFARYFENNKKELDNLVVYLESLELERLNRNCNTRGRSTRLANMACASCHAGERGEAKGRMVHRCVYIKERRDELSCGNCHPNSIPPAGKYNGYCPVELQHREACSSCHDSMERIK